MNDRLKFRVWDKVSKRYFYLELKFGDNGYHPDFITDPVFEQCTGLSDKNGKLIYEGDVVLFNDDDYPWQIKWNEVFARWVLYSPLGSNEDGEEELTDTDAEYLEIIGNIHERPEQKDVK